MGASFADQGLSPKTNYYYKISAIDGSNQESAKTAAVHKKTPSKPSACNPYSSDNMTHLAMLRAFSSVDDKGQVVARAVGSLEVMGPIDEGHFSELIKITCFGLHTMFVTVREPCHCAGFANRFAC